MKGPPFPWHFVPTPIHSLGIPLDFPGTLHPPIYVSLVFLCIPLHLWTLCTHTYIPLHSSGTLHPLPYVSLAFPCIPLALYTHSNTFPLHSPPFPMVLWTHSHTFPWHFTPTPIHFPVIHLHFPGTFHPLPYILLGFPCIPLLSPRT